MSETDPGKAEPQESEDNQERKPRGERTKRFLKVTAKAAGEELGGYYGDRVVAAGESWDRRREENEEERRKWHEGQESRRAAKAQAARDKAREAVEAAAAAPTPPEAEPGTANTPERPRPLERADEYLRQLERDKLYAGSRRGIATVDIEDPDDELRQALYDRLNVKEAEHWTRQSDATKSGSDVWAGWKHPLKIPKMPMRAAKYIKERVSGIVPLGASGSHFEVRRYLKAEDNETVIEEIFHQLKAGMSSEGEAGDMILASTRLIYAEDGAYVEKGDKWEPTKTLRAFQQLPITDMPRADKDIRPTHDVNLPPEGPEPGSLPDQGREATARGDVLPPAPDLGPGAVEATPRPVDHNHPGRKPKPPVESEPEPEPEIETVPAAPLEAKPEPVLELEPAAEPAPELPPDEVEPVPEIETVPAPPLEAKPETMPETEAETTNTGRKARRPRLQDPNRHPQLIDPSRPVEQRPYDGIARGSRLNEPGGAGLNTRRASSPEGPPAASAPAPEMVGQPEAPKIETAPASVPEWAEYSVERGRKPEDGPSEFSLLVHRVQVKNPLFGVPLGGELTDFEAGIILDEARSSDEVETLEQQMVMRDIQHSQDTKSKRPPLLGAGGKLVGRTDRERILIREIERKHEKFRQKELDAESKQPERVETQLEPEAQPVEEPVEAEAQPEAQRADTPEVTEIPETLEETNLQTLQGVYDNLSELLNGLGQYEDETAQSDELYRLAGLAVENGLVESDSASLAGVKKLSKPSSEAVGELSELFATGIEQMAQNLLTEETDSRLDIPESDAVREARVAHERETSRRGRRGGGSGKGGASRSKSR